MTRAPRSVAPLRQACQGLRISSAPSEPPCARSASRDSRRENRRAAQRSEKNSRAVRATLRCANFVVLRRTSVRRTGSHSARHCPHARERSAPCNATGRLRAAELYPQSEVLRGRFPRIAPHLGDRAAAGNPDTSPNGGSTRPDTTCAAKPHTWFRRAAWFPPAAWSRRAAWLAGCCRLAASDRDAPTVR